MRLSPLLTPSVCLLLVLFAAEVVVTITCTTNTMPRRHDIKPNFEFHNSSDAEYYRYCNQGWEACNKRWRRKYLNNSQRGGSTGKAAGHINSIGRHTVRVALWISGQAKTYFDKILGTDEDVGGASNRQVAQNGDDEERRVWEAESKRLKHGKRRKRSSTPRPKTKKNL